MASICIENASVSYFIRYSARPSSSQSTVGGKILRSGRRIEVLALQDLTLTAADGDRIGLVGRNGSGKSTLLKLCSGALSAQTGTVRVDGKVSAQFSLGAGIRASLSGRLNTELRCLYMGIAQSAIASRVAEIQELSGIGDFFDLPVSTYSAGMRSRLVMSLVNLVRPEILVMDEWIGAADASVSNTLTELQRRLFDSCSIILLANHSEQVIRSWTNKVAWLDKGILRAFGPTEEVLEQYREG